MALSYLPTDRAQQFLLPPDMRDWLPEGHLAWFVLDVVARLDTAALHARHANDGVGRRAYDPDMLLALLVYAYCTGQRSSRQIERLCEVDVAYRVICANQVPDHTTIARFRQDHEAAAVSLFCEVLMLCAAAGLATVGVVAVDGTTMGASASHAVNRSRDQIEAEVQELFAQAAQADDEGDRRFGADRGYELPAELADRSRRAARLDAALAGLRAQEAVRAEAAEATRRAREAAEAEAAEQGQGPRGRAPRDAEVGRAEAALARARQHVVQRYGAAVARREARSDKRGRVPVPPEHSAKVLRAEARLARAQAQAQARQDKPAPARRKPIQVNLTDPDSRLRKTRSGWAQGYNAQMAVNDQGVVLAAAVSQEHADVTQCQPMMAATSAMLEAAGIDEAIGTMLFDAGYCSTENLTAAGPDRLIATAKSYRLRQAARAHGWAEGEPPADADAIRAMEHRLLTQAGAALYAKRQCTVEPVFGHIKAGRGFRAFVRRGLAAVSGEWQLIAATNNILKLHRSGALLT